MRVITGTARGRVLKTLNGDATRPTTGKVKEAIFSSIQFELEGRRVLDLFAGSGGMGIEALSRGAEHAVFIDSNSDAAAVVRENLQTTGFTANSVVLCRKGEDFLLTCKEQFDVVFLDPPYGLNCIPQLFPMVLPHLSDHAVVVCEHAAASPLPETFGEFKAGKMKKYGTIAVTIYRKR